MVRHYFIGLFNLSWKIFALLLLIFAILELVERFGLLSKSYKKIGRYLQFLGFNQTAVGPLLAGFFFGIIYGAGVIADFFNNQAVEKKQVLLVSTFLAICHAIVEDTGLFLMLGANIFWLTVPRIFLATFVTFLTNRVFPN